MRFLILACFLLGFLANCTFGATEVVVALDTDLPATRTLTITVTVRNGSAAGDSGTVRTWTRGGPAGQIVLPQTFAIVPSNAPSPDGLVTLVVEAQLEPGDHGEPRLSLRRTARFRFMSRTAASLPIFLPASCGAVSTGCTSVAVGCTVSIRCEEMGQTCGNDGQCVSVDVVPTPLGADAANDVVTPRNDGGDVALEGGPGCTGINHMCAGACVSNASVASCGATSCTPCASVANGSATCDGTACGIACNAGLVLVNSACVPDVAPRSIAPLSTSTVTSRRPTLRWELPANATGAHIELCHDRACSNQITALDASGTNTALPTDLPHGVVYWRLRSAYGATAGLIFSPTWQFYVGARTAPIDSSWGTVLDVNGDGYADAMVGGDTYDLRVFLYLGDTAGLHGSPIEVPLPGSVGSFEHFAIASAGDINGDGFGDVVVGSSNTQTLFVFNGSATGLSAIPTTVPAPIAGQSFGYAVSTAGDANGDGYADVVVGDYNAHAQTGEAYVYFGSATGFGAIPQTLAAPLAGGAFGIAVSDAGDLDGDGFGDVLIDADQVNSIYVYRGTSVGLATTPQRITVAGIAQFGQTLASAGDVNGDGLDDFLAGTLGTANVAWLYYGSSGTIGTPTVLSIPNGNNFGAAVDGAGDLNGDGYADVVVGADLSYATAVFNGSANGVDTVNWRTFMGTTSSYFGRTLAGAGDVDGDGFDDLLIGAFNTPAVSLFPGSAAGAQANVFYLLQVPLGTGQFGWSLALLFLPTRPKLFPFWNNYS